MSDLYDLFHDCPELAEAVNEAQHADGDTGE